MAINVENFLTIRKLYPRATVSAASRLEVAPPQTPTELGYRDLLSEANQNYFHREYAVGLENYLALRQKILIQSHPEMPKAPGGGGVFLVDISKIEFSRIVELSRRNLALANPGDIVTMSLANTRTIQPGEFQPNPAVAQLATVGLDAGLASRSDLNGRRQAARDRVLEGDLTGAEGIYRNAGEQALKTEDVRLAAELTGEYGAMLATYTSGQNRAEALKRAMASFSQAQTLYVQAGDVKGQDVMRLNLENARAELNSAAPGSDVPGQPIAGQPETPQRAAATRTGPGVSSVGGAAAAVAAGLPLPSTTRVFQAGEGGEFRPGAALVAPLSKPALATRQLGVYTQAGTVPVTLARADYEKTLVDKLYKPRITANTLDLIDFFEEVETNFVAYVPHLFFFVLPIAIGDTYLALGQYANAISEYQKALAYPFLSQGIEAAYVWNALSKVHLTWGDALFRQELPEEAKARYEQIIKTDLTVPLASPLYQAAFMAPMRTAAAEVVKEIQGQPHAATNPKVAAAIMQANLQLQKIANGLNFLGIGPDEYPIFRFKYLEQAANYLADNAIQTERTFISFRSTAENQKLERIQLENAVAVNRTALQIEQTRLADTALEMQAARQTREYSELRRQNAQDTLQDWNTMGWELGTINAALSWAGVASVDQKMRYTGVRYNGQSHDFDTNVRDFYDTLTDWRENLNFELQQNRLERQVAESAAEVAIARTREQQAAVRNQIQELSASMAEKRLEGASQMLEYAQDRMFNEDLWFKLAGELQDLARSYLDMAIYAAFLMQRAYELEFDRRLNRIRLDYGIGGAEGLLGGDYLKRDIASFAVDYLQNAQKKNPVRAAISLREQFPAAFNVFLEQGILAFRTDLEIFDRRYPGTCQRKLKKIEVFVEGLVPSEGVYGVLTHGGVSTEWRLIGGNWVKHNRVMPSDRMLLSSYEYRRDYTVFTPSEEMLGLFENFGPQGNWRLELPTSSNNLDYQAISDIKFVLYFDAAYDESLRTFLKTFYPQQAGKSLIVSARFHFPDEYFRLDADKKVTFTLPPQRFAYNETGAKMSGFAVRLIAKDGSGIANAPLVITRASDGTSVNASSDANGLLQGAPGTMAPFGAWKDGSPADDFTVAAGVGLDTMQIGDIQLALNYVFAYRPDGTLAA